MNELNIKVILDLNDDLSILSNAPNLNYLPRQGEYYLDFKTKEVFKVSKVIHEDIRVILVVCPCDLKSKDIYNLVYNR